MANKTKKVGVHVAKNLFIITDNLIVGRLHELKRGWWFAQTETRATNQCGIFKWSGEWRSDSNRGAWRSDRNEPLLHPNKKENYPWWRHSVQEHEKNLTFVDHHTKGSNGKYTIDLTITCPPEYRFYYDLIVVDSNGKHEVIKKREVSLPPEASYRPEHITFSISLPSRYAPLFAVHLDPMNVVFRLRRGIQSDILFLLLFRPGGWFGFCCRLFLQPRRLRQPLSMSSVTSAESKGGLVWSVFGSSEHLKRNV